MDYCKQNYYDHPDRYDYNFYVKDVCGPYQLSRCALLYAQRNNLSILDWNMFNPDLNYYDKNIITKHMLTGNWGKETIEDIENMAKNEGISYEEAAKKRFLNILITKPALLIHRRSKKIKKWIKDAFASRKIKKIKRDLTKAIKEQNNLNQTPVFNSDLSPEEKIEKLQQIKQLL